MAAHPVPTSSPVPAVTSGEPRKGESLLQTQTGAKSSAFSPRDTHACPLQQGSDGDTAANTCLRAGSRPHHPLVTLGGAPPNHPLFLPPHGETAPRTTPKTRCREKLWGHQSAHGARGGGHRPARAPRIHFATAAWPSPSSTPKPQGGCRGPPGSAKALTHGAHVPARGKAIGGERTPEPKNTPARLTQEIITSPVGRSPGPARPGPPQRAKKSPNLPLVLCQPANGDRGLQGTRCSSRAAGVIPSWFLPKNIFFFFFPLFFLPSPATLVRTCCPQPGFGGRRQAALPGWALFFLGGDTRVGKKEKKKNTTKKKQNNTTEEGVKIK